MVDGRPERPRDSQDKRERLGPRLLHSKHGGPANCSDPQEMGLRPRLLRNRDAQPSLRPIPSLVLRDQPRQHRKERSQVTSRLSARSTTTPRKSKPSFRADHQAEAYSRNYFTKVQTPPGYFDENHRP